MVRMNPQMWSALALFATPMSFWFSTTVGSFNTERTINYSKKKVSTANSTICSFGIRKTLSRNSMNRTNHSPCCLNPMPLTSVR